MKTTIKRLSLLTTIVFAVLFNASAQTPVAGGTVSGHWTLAGSPYQIMGSVYIPFDSTLQIDPGVTVEFMTRYHLFMLVEGQLLAVGAPGDSITFIGADTTTGFGGIKFDDSSRYRSLPYDTSKMIYCKIQYGKDTIANYLNGNGGGLLFNHWSEAIVSHCLISHCFVDNGGTGYGAAIFCDSSSSPIITYNTITQNTEYYPAGGGGGIACNNSSSPLIAYNLIMHNTSYGGYWNVGYGGGIMCYNNANPTITHNNISYNLCAGGYNGMGGGIGVDNASPIITYDTIIYNQAVQNGGGIFVSGGSPVINHNDISYNSAYTLGWPQAVGGGLFLSGNITSPVNYNTISYNWAPYGGGMYLDGGTINAMDYNIIADNTADSNGGAIYAYNVALDTISNSTIVNNSVYVTKGNGGAMYLFGTSPVLMNVTITNNNANMGGALYCASASKPNFYNCILTNNTAYDSINGGGTEVYQLDQPSSPSFYYCDVQGGKAAFGLGPNFYTGTYSNNINAKPNFVSPPSGVGSSFNGLTANWNLQTGSPCIDAGDPLSPYPPYPSLDLGGNPRIVVCRIDMGAYENQYGISAPLQLAITPGSNSICRGNSTTLLVSGATTYNWTPSSGLSATNIANPDANPLITTTYTVIGTSGSCEAMDTITIGVKALPSITFSGNDSTCYGTASTINVGGGGTYLWSNPSSTSSSISVTPGITTTYTVAVTNNGCVKDSTFTLNVKSLPTVTFTGNDSTCFGTPQTINVSGGGTYLWSNPYSTSTSIMVNPATSTTYSVAVTYNGCVKDTGFALGVKSLPHVTFTGNDSTCYGTPQTINVSGGGTYLWTNPSSTSSGIMVNPPTTATYSVAVTYNGCVKDSSFTLNVKSLPAVSFSGNDSACYGTPTSITVYGGGTYLWSNPSSTSSSIMVSPALTTTYSVTVTKHGCVKDSTFTLNIKQLPSVSFSGTDSVCPGGNAIINVSGGGTYLWSNPFSTSSSISVFPFVATSYSVAVTKKGCVKDSSFTVNIKQLPHITFSPDDSTCKGTPAVITVSGGGTYLWNIPSSTSSSITVNPSGNTTYTVAVTYNGCTKDSTFTLFVNNLPSLSIGMSGHVLSANGAEKYSWSNGSTYDTAIVHKTGMYYVTGTNSSGCSSIDSIYYIASGIEEINNNIAGITVYPNPSNGQFNVIVNSKLSMVNEMQMEVYNVIGEKIYAQFTIHNSQFTIDLSSQPAGVYLYRVLTENGELVGTGRLVIQK